MFPSKMASKVRRGHFQPELATHDQGPRERLAKFDAEQSTHN